MINVPIGAGVVGVGVVEEIYMQSVDPMVNYMYLTLQ